MSTKSELETLLDSIEQRAEAASPAPWHEFTDRQGGRIGVDSQNYGCVAITGSNAPAAWEDAKFIAAARSDIPAQNAVITYLLDVISAILSKQANTVVHKKAAAILRGTDT